jgi:hypothetical protein
MNAYDQASYAHAISEFVRKLNEVAAPVEIGQTWVRIAPLDKADIGACERDPRLLPFLHVGSLAEIVDADARFVQVRVGGDSILLEHEVFLRTFVRAAASPDWAARPPAARDGAALGRAGEPRTALNPFDQPRKLSERIE